MRQIPVDTNAATVMVAQTPQVKVKDRRTGELALDSVTNAQLMTVSVLFAANDETEVIAVTVPQPGVPDGLVMGTLVGLTGLVARPWENEFGGQKRHGIAFRAEAVTPLRVTASSNSKS